MTLTIPAFNDARMPDPAAIQAAEERLWRQLCREAYDRGWNAAWEAGRRALLEELAEAERHRSSR